MKIEKKKLINAIRNINKTCASFEDFSVEFKKILATLILDFQVYARELAENEEEFNKAIFILYITVGFLLEQKIKGKLDEHFDEVIEVLNGDLETIGDEHKC